MKQTRACTQTHTQIYTRTHTNTHTHVHVYSDNYAHLCICVYACVMNACLFVLIYFVSIQLYVCTFAFIYMAHSP